MLIVACVSSLVPLALYLQHPLALTIPLIAYCLAVLLQLSTLTLLSQDRASAPAGTRTPLVQLHRQQWLLVALLPVQYAAVAIHVIDASLGAVDPIKHSTGAVLVLFTFLLHAALHRWHAARDCQAPKTHDLEGTQAVDAMVAHRLPWAMGTLLLLLSLTLGCLLSLWYIPLIPLADSGYRDNTLIVLDNVCAGAAARLRPVLCPFVL